MEVRKPELALLLIAALAGAACKRAPETPPSADSPELAAPAPSNSLVTTPLDQATTGFTNEMQAEAISKETNELGIQRISREAREGEAPPKPPIRAPFLTDEDKKQRAKDRQERLDGVRALRLDIQRQRQAMDMDQSVAIDGSTAALIAGRVSGGAIGVDQDAPGVWSGAYGGAVETGERVVESAPAWAELWGRLSRDNPPDVDFEKTRVAAIFAGERPTPGYRARLVGIKAEPTRYVVRWYEEGPGPDENPGEGASAPFLLVSVPKDAKAVRCEKIRRTEGPKRK